MNEVEEVIETSSAYEAENENNTSKREWVSLQERSQLSIKSSSHWYQLHTAQWVELKNLKILRLKNK